MDLLTSNLSVLLPKHSGIDLDFFGVFALDILGDEVVLVSTMLGRGVGELLEHSLRPVRESIVHELVLLRLFFLGQGLG